MEVEGEMDKSRLNTTTFGGCWVVKREERKGEILERAEGGELEKRETTGCGWLQNVLAMEREKRGRDHLDRVNGFFCY